MPVAVLFRLFGRQGPGCIGNAGPVLDHPLKRFQNGNVSGDSGECGKAIEILDRLSVLCPSDNHNRF